MSNHKNYRRKIRRDSRFCVCRSYYKKCHHSHTTFEKWEWNRLIRRDGGRFCSAWEREDEAERRCLVFSLKPYMD